MPLPILSLMLAFPFGLSATSYPMTKGNRITVLDDPYAAAEAKISLVRGAQHHIHILMYYWDNSPFGMRLAAEVRKAVDRGVEVRIIINKNSNIFFDPFEKIGHLLTEPGPQGRKAEVIYFNSARIHGTGLADCLHEKIFVVDGRKGIIGGRNISDEYFTWKDYDLLVEGPVVNSMQEHFKKTYEFVLDVHKMEGSFPPSPDYFPEIQGYEDGVSARILTNVPLFQKYYSHKGESAGEMKDGIMAALLSSEYKRLRLSAYFMILPHELLLDLSQRAKDGTIISVLSNGFESAAQLKFVVQSTFPEMQQLSEAGTRIFLWKKSEEYIYFHAKAAILDDDHVILGSHNFTIGSMVSCNEISIEFFSRDIGSYLAQEFDRQCSEDAEYLAPEVIAEKNKQNHHRANQEASLFKRILSRFI
jgi:phosphatidylserine/phosphatidylglycerophosphate/cardiolipin synthase-like enzyme